MKAVFDTRPKTSYDDDIVRRYHFPNRYLAEARKSVSDWIVYREPQRGGGRRGYIGVAHVTNVEPDANDTASSYALVSHFLPFDTVVPLRREKGYYETWLNEITDRSRIGFRLQGKSIRTIPDAEFSAITLAGFANTLDPEMGHGARDDAAQGDETVRALIRAPKEEQERRIVEMLVNRPLRDAAFRTSVVDAYRQTCAVTGLRIVNGRGRAEVQAAHIWPVAEGGPDIVQNGIALSATCHWLFDRYLISVRDDYGLLVSHNRVPSDLRNLFEKQVGKIHLPSDERLWPRLDFIARHRERFAGDSLQSA